MGSSVRWCGDSQGRRARDRSCKISLYLPLLLERFSSSSFNNPPNTQPGTRHHQYSLQLTLTAGKLNTERQKGETSAKNHLVKGSRLIEAISMFILSENGGLLSTIMQNIQQKILVFQTMDACLGE